MINTEKTVNGNDEVSMPGIIQGMKAMQDSGADMSQYRFRVDRFVVDAEGDDILRLETLYNRGMDGSGEVIIVKEKTFTDKDSMIVVITYMEKRLRDNPVTSVREALDKEKHEV